jgi:hypothetical protein
MIIGGYAGDREPWLEHMRSVKGDETFMECACPHPISYASWLDFWWAWHVEFKRPMTIVEHDIWPTREQLDRLNADPDPVVTFPYKFNKMGVPDNWVEGWSVLHPTNEPRGMEYTDFSGIGLIRFSAEAVPRILDKLPDDFAQMAWNNPGLDQPISKAIVDAGYRIKVLWPEVLHR